MACEPPGEARLLRAVARVEVAVEGPGVALVARRGDVEEREEQGDVARLGAEDRARRDGQQRAEALGAAVVAHVGLERLPVPLASPRAASHGASTGTSFDISLSCVTSAASSGRIVGSLGAVPGRAGVAVLRALALDDRDVVAGREGGEGADADLLGQLEHAALGRADERAAALGLLAARQLVVPHAAADAVARLDDEHRLPGPARPPAPRSARRSPRRRR